MDAKEYLMELRRLETKIRAEQKHLDELRTVAMHIEPAEIVLSVFVNSNGEYTFEKGKNADVILKQ